MLISISNTELPTKKTCGSCTPWLRITVLILKSGHDRRTTATTLEQLVLGSQYPARAALPLSTVQLPRRAYATCLGKSPARGEIRESSLSASLLSTFKFQETRDTERHFDLNSRKPLLPRSRSCSNLSRLRVQQQDRSVRSSSSSTAGAA